jgi:hypothetical protein
MAVKFTNPYAVAIPSDLNMQSLELVMRGVVRSHQVTQQRQIIFDFSQLRFAEPTGVVGLANFIGYLQSTKFVVSFINENKDTIANRYLDEAGFFQAFMGRQVFGKSTIRSTTVPFRHFSNTDYISYLYNQLEPWIGAEIHVSGETLATIRACLEEVFHNIEYHSGTAIGFTVSQHFPKLNLLKIAISDFGWGIPKRVATKVPGLTDWEAIQQACVEGFSTYTAGVKNRGAGLAQLINYVVRRNGGFVEIRSLRGYYKVSLEGIDTRASAADQAWHYPGTLVHVCLRTDTLESASDDVAPEVFTW